MRLLAERINEAIQSRLIRLADPKSKAKDHAEYLGRVEGIHTLREVVNWMEDVNRELGGPESDNFPNRAVRQHPRDRERPTHASTTKNPLYGV